MTQQQDIHPNDIDPLDYPDRQAYKLARTSARKRFELHARIRLLHKRSPRASLEEIAQRAGATVEVVRDVLAAPVTT